MRVAKFILSLALFMPIAPAYSAGNNWAQLRLHMAFAPEATAYFNALSSNGCATPTAQFKTAVNVYINAEKAAGNWGSNDASYILATADFCTASVNLAQPNLYQITWNGPCTISVAQGLNGDSATCYGDTGVNQNALKRMSQNNARIDAWTGVSKGQALGLVATTNPLSLNPINNAVTKLNSNTGVTDTGGGTGGLKFAWRTNSSAVTTGINGVVQSNAVANTSITMAAAHVGICTAGTLFCSSTIGELYVSFGAPLTSESAHYTNVRNLLIALGVTGI